MLPRPRLLHGVMFAAAALLAIKVVSLWSGGAAVAIAWGETKNAEAAADTDAAATPSPSRAAPAANATSMPAAASASPAKAAAKPGAAKAGDADVQDPLDMSPAEIRELQELARRRAELDKRAAELNEREVLMQAAEQRVDEKIAKLQSLDKSIKAEVKTEDAAESARLKSLANMYQQMRPQDAARILDQLDVPVVVSMISHMSEMKAAPVLAAMDASKAKAVTLALAEQRKSTPAPSSAAAAPAAP